MKLWPSKEYDYFHLFIFIPPFQRVKQLQHPSNVLGHGRMGGVKGRLLETKPWSSFCQAPLDSSPLLQAISTNIWAALQPLNIVAPSFFSHMRGTYSDLSPSPSPILALPCLNCLLSSFTVQHQMLPCQETVLRFWRLPPFPRTPSTLALHPAQKLCLSDLNRPTPSSRR